MADSSETTDSARDDVSELRRALGEERRQTALFTDSLIPIGLALLRETDLTKLLEMILREAQRLSTSDGATLYMRREDRLDFFMVLNRSLKIEMGGSSGQAITLHSLRLIDPESHEPNLASAACYSALKRESLNLENIYENKNFDFSGSRRFDLENKYYTTSLLTVPLAGADGETVAVLQLINAIDFKLGERVPFSASIQRVVEALAALAAGALESFGVKEQLYQQQQLYLRNLETTQARLREELDEAEKYIRAILPPPCDLPLKIDWLLASCSELGGDSFGYHEIDADHWALYVLWQSAWRMPTPWSQILLACTAVICGILVGGERQRREKPAGLRTLSLVCLGAATFTMMSFAFTTTTGDSGRVAAQIVTGIGFLGAGVILHGRRTVSGMTTAAIIWVTAAIGMVVGGGYILAGLGLSVLVNRVMVFIFMYETRWHPDLRNASVTIEYELSGGLTRIRLERVLSDYEPAGSKSEWSELTASRGRLKLRIRLARVHLTELLAELAEVPEVSSIVREPTS